MSVHIVYFMNVCVDDTVTNYSGITVFKPNEMEKEMITGGAARKIENVMYVGVCHR